MTPTKIKLRKNSGQLELEYSGIGLIALSGEYLRVHSPSAEVRGHGAGQDVLQYGKKMVTVVGVERAGNYALKLIFSDGHDTGLYSWEYLYQLATEQEKRWEMYLQKLQAAGKHREADVQVVQLQEPNS